MLFNFFWFSLLYIFIIDNNIYAKSTYELSFYESGYLYTKGQGIDKDVVEEIQKIGKYNFEFNEKPRARIWQELEQGKLAMSVSGIETPERDKFAYFIPYINQKNKLILLKNSKYKNAKEIINDKKASLAIVRSFKHGKYYDDFIQKMKEKNHIVYEVTSVPILINMLSLNRVTAIITTSLVYSKELKERNLRSSVEIKDWDKTTKGIPHCLILSKKFFNQDDVNKFKKIITDMKKNGSLKKIFKKYLSKTDTETALDF